MYIAKSIEFCLKVFLAVVEKTVLEFARAIIKISLSLHINLSLTIHK